MEKRKEQGPKAGGAADDLEKRLMDALERDVKNKDRTTFLANAERLFDYYELGEKQRLATEFSKSRKLLYRTLAVWIPLAAFCLYLYFAGIHPPAAFYALVAVLTGSATTLFVWRSLKKIEHSFATRTETYEMRKEIAIRDICRQYGLEES